MSQGQRKILLLVLKLSVAAVLLGWVLTSVHWKDYVLTRDGTSYVVTGEVQGPAGQQVLPVARGLLWWRHQLILPLEQVESEKGQQIRPGMGTVIAHVRPLPVIAAMLAFVASVLVVAVRWRYLLRVQEIELSRWEAVRLTFLGYYYNLVVPGTVGGDLVKAYYVSKGTPRKAAALVSVFVDRAMGLLDLTILAIIMMTIVVAAGLPMENLPQAVWALLIIAVITAGGFAFLLSARFRRALHLQRFYQRLPIAHHIAAAGDAALKYRQNLGVLAGALGLTLVAHLLWVGAIATGGWALGMATPWYRYFVCVPLIYIIASAPITPGAVGLLEGLYVKFLATGDVSSTQALALAVLARAIQITWSLPGLVAALTGPRASKAVIQAEMAVDASTPSSPGQT